MVAKAQPARSLEASKPEVSGSDRNPGVAPGALWESIALGLPLGLVQRQSAASGTGEPPPLGPVVEAGLQTAGKPLAANERSYFEAAWGRDFGAVRVHDDAAAAASAQALGALAYTLGSHVAVAAASEASGPTLAHELAHVVQQGHAPPLGRTASPPAVRELAARAQLGPTADGLEAEADAAAASMSAPSPALVGPRVQRVVDVPIEGAAPSTAPTIEEFILLVEAEEAKYPASDQTNTPLMITRIRKIFYGESSWDQYLIPGAAGVAAPYAITRVETGRELVDMPGPLNIDVVRRSVTPHDATGAVPALFNAQEVRLPDGKFIDMGHVFAGLDAIQYPDMVDGPGTVNISSNVDAVTWVGDLGSVLAEWQFRYVNLDRQLTDSEAQASIDEYAPAQDMLGNIDAYVIGAEFGVENQLSGMKVSEILRQYYLGTGASADARNNRYATYCRSVGLTGWNGSAFSNEADWISYYTDEINDAAALYIGANTEGVASYPFALGMSGNPGAGYLARRYLAALKARYAAEIAPHAP